MSANKEKEVKEVIEKEDKKPEFYICAGKSLTSKRGILNEGDELKANWLPGGKDRVTELIKQGVVAKG